MADFVVRLNGVTWQNWEDAQRDPLTLGADDKGAPSRINPDDDHPQQFMVGVVGGLYVLQASLDNGATWGAALDVALGGRLFYARCIERPHGTPPVAVTPQVDQSTVQFFTPLYVGHYALMMRRPESGSVILHLDVLS